MKILLLINWKITYCEEIPSNLQPSDYSCPKEIFWFFKYFKSKPNVDVVDIQAPKWIESLEKKIRFQFYQTFKVLRRLKEYDLIFVHGSTSAMLLCAMKRIFRIKTPPICVVDISSFHQAYEKGLMTKLAQFASKEFDYMIYHTSTQIEYYKNCFPWLVDKSKFVLLGVDYKYWNKFRYEKLSKRNQYIICVGYRKRDWNTLIEAYENSGIKEELFLVGNDDIQSYNPKIKVIPFLPIEKLNTYIVNAKYSVIPLEDFNYSFGQLTLLQQMALGVPILISDARPLRDYSKYSKGVCSYRSSNVNDLRNKLIDMSNKTDLEISRMIDENKKACMTFLSEKNMAECIEKCCLELINGIK